MPFNSLQHCQVQISLSIPPIHILDTLSFLVLKYYFLLRTLVFAFPSDKNILFSLIWHSWVLLNLQVSIQMSSPHQDFSWLLPNWSGSPHLLCITWLCSISLHNLTGSIIFFSVHVSLSFTTIRIWAQEQQISCLPYWILYPSTYNSVWPIAGPHN